MRLKIMLGAGFAAALAASTGLVAPLSSAQAGPKTDYLVLFKGTSPDGAARAAITRSGGTVREVNSKIGYAYVTTTRSDFATSLTRSGAVVGVAAERSIGSAGESRRARSGDVERLAKERAAAPVTGVADARARHRGHGRVTPEPLAELQWDMRQIGATATGSYAKDQGAKRVRVGIIDTGIDGSHPDIAPNFDRALSRNFVTDMPDIDGPCEHPTASTRSTRTTTGTAPTSPARSARRSTGSASRVSHRRWTWSTSGPVRTRASSSSSRRSRP